MKRVTGLLCIAAFALPTLAWTGCSRARRDNLGTSTSAVAKWVPAGTIADKRVSSHAFRLPSGSVLVYGGLDSGSNAMAATVLFDPATLTFASSGSSHNYVAADAFWMNEKVFLPGGEGSQTFDEGTHTWSTPDGGARGKARAIMLTDGRVLVMGGQDYTLTPNTIATCRIYSPGTNTWADAASMSAARVYFGVAKLPNGHVLVSGGYGVAGSLKDAEIYDPATNGWSPAASMTVARDSFELTNLPDGKVLAIGGASFSPSAATEVYDPVTNGWAAGPMLGTPRSQIPVVPLGDGRLLLPGGEIAGRVATDIVEIFDPQTMSVTPTTSLSVPRANHAAVALGNGEVLVVGGADGTSGPVTLYDTAEKYVLYDDAGVPEDGGDDTGAIEDTEEEVYVDPFEAGTTPVVTGSFEDCASGEQCPSGFCVDGVCCDSKCDQPCHSCRLPGAPGRCTQVPVGMDLRGDCGNASSCLSTCGPAGKCVTAQAGSQCAASACTSGSKGRGPVVCAGAGVGCNISAGVEFDCAPYACEKAFGACRTTCTSSDQCAGGFFCDGTAQRCVRAPDESDEGCAVGTGPVPRAVPAFFASIFALGALAGARRRRASRR